MFIMVGWDNRSDFPPIFMTLIPGLTFTELRVVSMEHLQRVWLASRERLPFQTPGSVPLLVTCLCSNWWNRFYRTCHIFFSTFHLEYPSVHSRLCSLLLWNRLNGIKRILTGSKVTTFSTKFVFRAGRKTKMAAQASDWLSHVGHFLWNYWTEVDNT